ncbi:MAG: imidazolonepropionase [bacterium]|nr:imidazolonepropionase [bacterium]
MSHKHRVSPGATDRGDVVDLLVTNIGELCTIHDPDLDESVPRRREDLGALNAIAGAALAVGDGKVVAWGEEEALVRELWGETGLNPAVETVDAGGACVVPGYVDPHTHAIFGRTRQDEYERRIRGESYLEIAAAGGGIQSSVKDLRQRSEQELVDLAVPRLREMLRHGTTTVEIKSGYGLDLDWELMMLRAAGAAAREAGIGLVRTCLAAHEIPPEYRGDREKYLDIICREILPRVAAEQLADRVDVFCEPSVFTLAESERILAEASGLALGGTIHADELEPYGGAILADRLGAESADHLIEIDDAGIAALADSRTVAVLLPGTVFTLGLDHYAPARKMIDAGCALALATDFNPGSCPILSVPLIQAIACTQMRLTPAEALVASTRNPAFALDMAHAVGSLAPHQTADFLILDGDDHRLVPYRAGHNPVRAVFSGGKKVFSQSSRPLNDV